MSIIIKGMEMPKHAVKNGSNDTMYRSCILVHPDGTAELVVDLEFADMFNFEHCLKHFPLVPLPEKHGRLIDAESIIDMLERSVPEKNRGHQFYVFRHMLRNAPTAIEAEDGE